MIYLNTPITWMELIKWDEEISMGPIYILKKTSDMYSTDLKNPIVALYAWTDDKNLAEGFLNERNRDLFIVKDIKLDNDGFLELSKEYAEFKLCEYEIPIIDEQGVFYPNDDVDTFKIIATRYESAFLTDSTDTLQFIESFKTRSAIYTHNLFKEDLSYYLNQLSYFNSASKNFNSVYQLELILNDDFSPDDKDEYSLELIEDATTAEDNGYSVIDGRPLIIRNFMSSRINYMRLFRFAFWYTYIDTVPDYSLLYH